MILMIQSDIFFRLGEVGVFRREILRSGVKVLQLVEELEREERELLWRSERGEECERESNTVEFYMFYFNDI